MNPVSRIRVLPPSLADQIAAGEVVERPASVVKELCENSLDAGARHIDIDIEAGGRKSLRVVDDGGGMTMEEARLAMLRHATSKIQQAEDLWGLLTFGFRGEALPSIAAVSRLTLRTRASGAMAGFWLQFEAGVETSSGEIGMPEGTQFEVRDLFWNTPARLKFLKSEATETAAVSEAVLRLSLAYPEVHFRLKANGRQLMDLPPHRDLPERVRAALARRGATLLHEARGEEAGVKVRAFLGPPEDASTTPRSTLLFVARRFVRDRSLLHALCMGYGELLEKGRYPMSALFVEVPGEELDINVHPQKLEVRFARPQEVYGAVRHVVGQAIAQAPWLAPVDTHAYSLPPEHLDESPHSASEPLRRPVVAEPRSRSLSGATTKGSPPIRSLFETKRIELQAIAAVSPMGESHPPTTPGFFSSLGYVGQAHNTYLLCENEAALIIVDQHAAHERILFERLRQAHRQKVVPQQRLLFPIPIELPDELAAMTTQAFVPLALAELGFETEPFGLKTLLLRSVPELLKNADPKPLLLDVLAGLSGEESAHLTEERMDKLFATMACHAALRGGDSILPESARALLSQLDGVDMRSHCPHGRPVLLQFSWSEIEGRLERT